MNSVWKSIALTNLLAASSLAHAYDYTVTVIGSSWGSAAATSLNDSGSAVGFASGQSSTGSQAAFFANGTTTFIPPSIGQWGTSTANAINNTGTVVGQYTSSSGSQSQPFFWQNGGTTFLPLPTGAISGGASSINDSGEIVGWARFADQTSHAVKWVDKQAIDISALPNGQTAIYAQSINNAGQIAGYLQTGNNAYQSFLLSGDTVTPLTDAQQGGSTFVNALNNAGIAVGNVDFRYGFRAVYWKDGTSFDLEPYAQGDWVYSSAYGINDHGDIVGFTGLGSAKHAFIWKDGQMQDLNTLADLTGLPQTGYIAFESAFDINNAGQIIASGPNQTIYLLTPSVPEPTEVAMMLTGLLVLSGWARKRAA